MEIYLHWCSASEKGYVGQTSRSMEKRWDLHVRGAHSEKTPAYNTLIAKAIRKYGADAFEHQVLSTAKSQAELDNLERLWIILLQTKVPNGYNLADGGYAAAGHIVSPEVRARLSDATKAQWADPEFRKLYTELRTGKKQPGISAAKTGVKQSAETIAKRVAKITGKKRTPEQCARLSELRQGQGLGSKRSDETRAKMSAAQQARSYESKIKGKEKLRGRKRTPETIQKMIAGFTPEGKERRRVALLGNKHSLGYKFSPEIIAKRTATAKRNRELKKQAVSNG